MSERIGITRLGLVTSLGLDVRTTWSALREGRSGRAPLRLFPTEGFRTSCACEVPDWRPERFWRDRKVAYYTRSAQFALKAAQECLEGLGAEEREGLGIVVGSQYSTAHNCHRLLEEPDFMTPIKFLSTLPSSTPTNVSLSLGLRGVTTAVSSSSAGLEAVGYVRDLLASCHAPALLAGGAEELSLDVFAGCHRLGVLAGQAGGGGEGELLAAESHGLVPGEAAAVLLAEKESRARAAGRVPLAWIAGWADAYAPGGGEASELRDAVEAGERALAAALASGGLAPGEVGAVFTGANGTSWSDAVARRTLARVFGPAPPPVIPLKGALGETFGAFGAVAAALACLALRDGVLPGGRAAAGLTSVLIHDYGCEGSHAALVLRAPGAGFGKEGA